MVSQGLLGGAGLLLAYGVGSHVTTHATINGCKAGSAAPPDSGLSSFPRGACLLVYYAAWDCSLVL